MQLSKYFTRFEFERSDTAIGQGVPNVMNAQQLKDAKALCTNVLDKIRDYYGKPVIISSGYRGPHVNQMVRGVSTSQHCKGQAADFTVVGVTVNQVFSDIVKGKIDIPFDQVIHEFGAWVHISYDPVHNRRQGLIATKNTAKKTVYTSVLIQRAPLK